MTDILPDPARFVATGRARERAIGCASCSWHPSPPVNGRPTATSSRPPARPTCVVVDPGQDAAAGVAAAAQRARADGPRASCPPTATSTTSPTPPRSRTSSASRVWIHSATGTCSPTRLPALSPDGAALVRQLLRVPMVEPARVEELDGLPRADARRAGVHRAPTHPATPPGSVLFGLAYAGPTPQITRIVFTGDVVFAGSIGRTDLPGGDQTTMNQTLRDVVLPLRRRLRRCCPATVRRPRWHASARQNPYLQPAVPEELMARPKATVRFPRVHARPDASSSSASSRRCADTFELHGFGSIETRAVEPMEQLTRKGEIDKEVFVVRRLHAAADAARRPRPALRPDRAVRPLRAGELRPAGVPVPALPDPEGVARRAAAGGPLPRVHPGRHRHRRRRRPWPPTTTSSCRWSRWRRWRSCTSTSGFRRPR